MLASEDALRLVCNPDDLKTEDNELEEGPAEREDGTGGVGPEFPPISSGWSAGGGKCLPPENDLIDGN